MKKTIWFLFFLAVLFVFPAIINAGQIHEAAKEGDVEKVKELLDKDLGLLCIQDEQGKTPLHWATGRGQLEVMKLLLETYHVDVNVRNKNGGTPLHVAASQAKPEAAKILIRNGAFINARAKNGAIPLHFAALKRREGHLEVAKILLENKADVNAKMNNDVTPLAMALFGGNSKMADLLRQYGAKEPARMPTQQRKTFAPNI